MTRGDSNSIFGSTNGSNDKLIVLLVCTLFCCQLLTFAVVKIDEAHRRQVGNKLIAGERLLLSLLEKTHLLHQSLMFYITQLHLDEKSFTTVTLDT